MNLTSKKVTVQKSAEALFDFLCDVKNFEKLMPDTISKFEIIRDDAFVFALKGMPEIALELKEVNSPIQAEIRLLLVTNFHLLSWATSRL